MTDHATLKKLDEVLSALQERTRTSVELHRKLVGRLPEEGAILFHRLKDGHYDEGTASSLTELVHRAARASGRTLAKEAAGAKPAVTVLPNTRLIVATYQYPGSAVSDREEKAPLTVTVWVCPDRATALHLLWLRRRGITPDATSAVQDLRQDTAAASQLLTGPEQRGELTYWYDPQEMVNEALKKGDPRVGRGRVGMLRDNLVVEAQTHSYVRRDPKAEWRARGLVGNNLQEVLAFFKSLEEGLKADEKKKP